MKSIDEAAKEYALLAGMAIETEIEDNDGFDHESFIDDAFKAGIEFAERWIPVDEELPEITDINNHNAINVRFKTIHGDIRECTATFESVTQHCFENSPRNNKWYVYPSGGHELRNITHWRPINHK